MEGIAATLITLRKIVERHSMAKLNDDLAHILDVLGKLLGQTGQERTAATVNAERTLNHLQAIFNRDLAPLDTSQRQVTTELASFELVVDGPGTLRSAGQRHSNDHENISDIQILPARDELAALHAEYLPVQDPAKSHLPGLQGVIDRNFRLLREDTVGQLRDAIRIAIDDFRRSLGRAPKASTEKRTGSRFAIYEDVGLHQIRIGRKGLAMELSFKQPFRGAKQSQDEIRRWWEASKSLNEDALVCLIGANGFISFLTVCEEPQFETRKQALNSRQSLYKDVKRGRLWVQQVEPHNFSINGINRSFRAQEKQPMMLCEFPGILLPAFYHTLQALQSQIKRLDTPFADLIAHQPGLPLPDVAALPDYARVGGFSFDLSSLTGGSTPLTFTPGRPFDFNTLIEASTLDPAQQNAVISALGSKLALIQGPPGTGKSFCGVALIKALLANKDRGHLGPIICVCYTNHALDQLLKHLASDQISQIIRIGGQSKEEALRAINLREVAKSADSTPTERKSLAQCHGRIEELEALLKPALQAYATPATFSEICDHLKSTNVSQYKQLIRLGKVEVDEAGFEIVTHDKRPPLQRFLQPHNSPAFRSEHRNPNLLLIADIDTLSLADRQSLLNIWRDSIRQERQDSLRIMLKDYHAAKDALRKSGDERDLRCLRQANVIGLTTSGLARRIDLVRRLPSKVLVCEEAGEVLEAHLITAIIPTIEHCILIGDHEQLRPQVQNYDLQSVNPRGQRYSLDMSLFERLIQPPAAGMPQLPFTTLQIQRRMHPSISNLIRQTLYPHLQDHESVHNYPEVAGMARRLFWLDHQNAEESKDHTKSYCNLFEIEMVAALVSHLTRQCQYTADEIAVLTPYLGQLRLLNNRLRGIFEVVIDERDNNDLEKHGLQDTDTSSAGGTAFKSNLLNTIRLATVDNFQGEEAKVVIISLVRSNEDKKCGFLKTTNRANVLLSRAKHGMYLIGDSTCYKPQPMWSTVVDLLQADGNFGRALDLTCPRHPERPIAVSTPDDFVRLSPEGGCSLKCSDRLPCGHQCPQKCHAKQLHDNVYCHIVCNKVRSCGHICAKDCGAPCGKCEEDIENVRLQCGHVSTQKCFISQNTKLAYCKEPVARQLACGHSQIMDCSAKVDEQTVCKTPCNTLLPCSHICLRQFSDCRKTNQGHVSFDHGKCTKVCDRGYAMCNHRCASTCHDGTHCPPCSQSCNNSCHHSKCGKNCNEPCAPCAQPCTSGCSHSGQCLLPCAAPCDILPCSKRCEELLACGHQCISCCGEICPSEQFCQVCCTQETRSQVVDWTELVEFGNVNLDEDPCFVLSCGHMLSMTSLDGIMEMAKHYDSDDSGGIISVKDTSGPFSASVHLCVQCREPIQNLHRYDRVWRRANLDLSTKKFIAWSTAAFIPLSQNLDREEYQLAKRQADRKWQDSQLSISNAKDVSQIKLNGPLDNIIGTLTSIPDLYRRYKPIVNLRRQIHTYQNKVNEAEQPFGRVYNMLRSIQIQQGLTSSTSPNQTILQTKQRMLATSLSIRCDLVIITDFFNVRRSHADIFTDRQDWRGLPVVVDFDQCYDICLVLLREADERKYPMQQVESMIYFARFAALDRSNADKTASSEANIVDRVNQAKDLLEEASQLCVTHPGSTAGMTEEVEAAQKMLRDETFYEPVTNEEKKAIIAAMGFNVTGHWYFCANGHPYVIGECGMAMEAATCPECGAGVGGGRHQMMQGNVRATEGLQGAMERMAI